MSESHLPVGAIFEAAIELPVDRRAAYLQAACAGDEALRQRVEDLLRAHEMAGTFMGSMAVVSKSETTPTKPLEQLGERIGRYKLLQQIGEGGCGVVYMAEQEEPVRRRVALKVIKLGMDTENVIARFEAERQALALMDHPNIAKVLDAGATDNGRPYFVMELVRGIKITDYCDQNNLSTQTRLDLFMQVCRAVQHAHQKGIIHRDIKPSNILVTVTDGVPMPKVIDFGIAKATQGKLTDDTLFTAFEQFIGTPAYMSPEQAEMSTLDIDTRSDIYSLGVLLYELLTGKTPFDAQKLLKAGLDEIRRTIREQEPSRPSTRLSTMMAADLTTIAAHRQAQPPKLIHLVRGDLDWIVMKALEKDRTRRYETANGFAADIQRHLNNEPVTACPPGNLYKFQKMVRRNKLVFAAASAVIAALIIGLGVSTWMFAREKKAHQQTLVAEREQSRLRGAAEQAQVAEAGLRKQAQADGLAARRRAYAADMLLCQQALIANNLRRARLLLERQHPASGEEDLRGWEWRYLWQRCQGDALFKLNMQGRHALNAMFTKDGKSVVVFTGKGRVSLWNLTTLQEDAILQDDWSDETFSANSGQLNISTDGEWIVAADRTSAGESVVRIWDVNRKSIISELTIGTNTINALALSPDKQRLAVYVRENETVSVWNVGKKQIEVQLPHSGTEYYRNACGAVAFSPDGAFLAIGDYDGQVRLMNTHNWTEKAVLPGQFPTTWGVSTLAYSPNGRFLAAGSAFVDPRIQVWDMGTDKNIATLEGHLGFIADLAFSPDGKILASASGDQTIKLWNTDTWKEEHTLLGHNDEVWSVAFSSDGKQLASAGKDGYVRLWPVSGKRQDRESLILPSEIQGPDISPDGTSVVGISVEGKVRLLKVATLEEKRVPPELGTNNVVAFWVSRDEILFGSQSPLQLKTWDLANNAITSYPLDAAGTQVIFNYLPDSHLLVLATSSRVGNITLTMWDTLSHQQVSSHAFKEPFAWFRTVTYTKNGKWVAMAEGHDLSVWNTGTGQNKPVFKVEINSVQGVALFSERPWVVAASMEAPIVNIWNILTGKKVLSLEGHNQILSSISVSPDQRRLITSTIGQEPIRFWDTESWNELLNIQVSPGCIVSDPRFLSDGNTLAAVETDIESGIDNVRLWHVPSWAEIAAAEAKEKADARLP
jgi:eukaryotic-like serine/threonine-protein kinase